MATKRYRKRGQIDIYEPEKQESSFGAIVFWALVIVVVVAACNGG